MRIQNLTITKQNNIDVIRYDLSASDEYDDTIYDKVVTADNIFNYQYDDRGGVRSITSYANRGMPLDVLMKNTLTKKQVCSVLRGLISILELDAKGIPSSGIVLNPKYIYVDGEGLSVKCVCIPLIILRE